MQPGGACVGWWGGSVAGTCVVSSMCTSRHVCAIHLTVSVHFQGSLARL